MSIADKDLRMWEWYTKHRSYTQVEALESWMPGWESDPVLMSAVAAYKAADLAIEGRMKQLIEALPDEDN